MKMFWCKNMNRLANTYIAHYSGDGASKNHKYVMRVRVGSYPDGTKKFRYFYTMSEFNRWAKAKGKVTTLDNGGMINKDLLGTEDPYEDYKSAGVSDKDNYYSIDKVSNRAKSDRIINNAKHRKFAEAYAQNVNARVYASRKKRNAGATFVAKILNR